MLKDLAATRQQVSVNAAESTGADVPDRLTFVARQRESLRVMQMQLQVLGGTVQWMELARLGGRCVCESAQERLQSIMDEMRRQVELSCQELSRQQTAWQLQQQRADRQQVDDCEAGVRQQIEWLRARREELLEEAAHPVLSRLAHTVRAERQFCGCPEHSATMRATTPRVVTRKTIQERTESEVAARPGDDSLRLKLAETTRRAWERWQGALALSSELERQRLAVIREFNAIDVEPQITELEARLRQLREQRARLEALQLELLNVEAELRRIEGQVVRDRASRVITEASEHLELLTLGRYRALRTSNDGTRLQVIAENDSPYVAAALSRGTLFQVALALRVALVDEYARRGLEFPLVLDDVLVDSDEHRLEAAAQLLSAASGRGRQILFLTCQDHLVDMLEDRGALIHGLPGSIRVRQARPTFVPAVPPMALPVPEPVPPRVTVAKSAIAESASLPAVAGTPVALDEEAGSEFDSPLSLIPSLSAQTAQLLNFEGIETIGQLLELHPGTEGGILVRLGIGRNDLVTWQAEGMLLCTLPELSRDDVQLLVAVGVSRPEELAAFHPDALWQRVQRFRGSIPQPWHAWMRDRNSWPREDEVARWIHLAGHPGRRHVIELHPGSEFDSAEDGDQPEDDGPQPAGDGDAPRRSRRRRSRRPRHSLGAAARGRTGATASTEGGPRYFLTSDSPIVDAPSIGPKTARMLNRAGVQTVMHLLQRSPAELAETIADRSVPAEMITAWQQQSRLMCEIPELRGHDAQLLVACDSRTVEALATANAFELQALLEKFARSKPASDCCAPRPPRNATKSPRGSKPPARSSCAALLEPGSRVLLKSCGRDSARSGGLPAPQKRAAGSRRVANRLHVITHRTPRGKPERRVRMRRWLSCPIGRHGAHGCWLPHNRDIKPGRRLSADNRSDSRTSLASTVILHATTSFLTEHPASATCQKPRGGPDTRRAASARHTRDSCKL